MKELRRNEFIDLLEMSELIYENKDHSILCDIIGLGSVTYFPKSNKLNIHKSNEWVDDGFYYTKNILKNK